MFELCISIIISTFLTLRVDEISAYSQRLTTMSLPQSLRTSVTPPELELIASQQLVEIIPLIAMEKTAFISVRIILESLLYAFVPRAYLHGIGLGQIGSFVNLFRVLLDL